MEKGDPLMNEGFRFRPTDEEGLTFLLRYISGQAMNDSGLITTHVDTYGILEPWDTYTLGLPCGDEDGDFTHYRFFITKLKKKKPGSRYSREVGNKGTWRQQDKGKPIRKNGGPVIGFRKNMSYVNKGYDKKDGTWLMKEYELSSPILEKFDDDRRHYVLCALKKRPSKAQSVLNDVPETPAFLKFQESTHESAVESTSDSNLCRNSESKIPAVLKFKESAVESTCTTSYDAGDYNVQSNSVPGLDSLELRQQINKDLEVLGRMDVNFVVEPLLAPYTNEATSMFSFDHEYLPDLDPWDIVLDADDIYQILHGEPEVLQMDQAQQHAEPVN